ncbi:MAG: cyclase family protein [Chthonomonadales bacterium]
MKIIDITVPVTPATPAYPGKVAFSRSVQSRIEESATANCSSFTMDCHFGTHVDAPLHFVRDGIAIHEIDLARLNGACSVIEVSGRRNVTLADLKNLKPGCRVLLKTCGSAMMRSGHAPPDQLGYLEPEAAQLLVDLDARMVGIDGYSIDDYDAGEPCHHILLPAGILIVECLDLADIEPGDYDVSILPLKLVGCEASPARAILW